MTDHWGCKKKNSIPTHSDIPHNFFTIFPGQTNRLWFSFECLGKEKNDDNIKKTKKVCRKIFLVEAEKM